VNVSLFCIGFKYLPPTTALLTGLQFLFGALTSLHLLT